MSRTLICSTIVLFAILAAGIVGPGDARAQEPIGPGFTYQGELTDDGSPVTDTCDFEFGLWDAKTDGNQIGSTIPANGTPVDAGRFSVTLDFGDVFTGDALWLEIAVKCSGDAGFTLLSPRTPLTAAPYSQTVRPGATVEGAWDSIGDAIFSASLSNGNVEGALAKNALLAGVGVYGKTSSPGAGVWGETNDDNSWGVYGVASSSSGSGSGVRGEANGDAGSGVYGRATSSSGTTYGVYGASASSNGSGVFATNTANGTDLIIGGTADDAAGDNGHISSDPNYLGSDIILTTYDAFHVRLDANNGGELGDFEIHHGDDTRILRVDENRELGMYLADGTETVELVAQEGSTGGQLTLRDSAGRASIAIDAEYGTGGDGRITTDVLEITGGADLSEQFNVRSRDAGTHPAPGMVVSIDPEHPGELIVSEGAYDRTVAGVVSGAGDVKPGMLMGQAGSAADGALPVALTGRVYVNADASYGAIEVGDLLTTSDTPGHAMKVTDYERARGAILGKAMTALDEGQGLVLVLVTLQ